MSTSQYSHSHCKQLSSPHSRTKINKVAWEICTTASNPSAIISSDTTIRKTRL
ncbi:hypothetical protein LINPERHAP2_LOCUS6136 [Linum perenne]